MKVNLKEMNMNMNPPKGKGNANKKQKVTQANKQNHLELLLDNNNGVKSSTINIDMTGVTVSLPESDEEIVHVNGNSTLTSVRSNISISQSNPTLDALLSSP